MTMLQDQRASSSRFHLVHRPVEVRCLVCGTAFDFQTQAAVVLRHVAYGYGLAHEGECEQKALQMIFVEPGYDCAAYAHDTERRRVLAVEGADGWSAVVPESPERILGGSMVRFEPLRFWALVEHRDGSLRTEGVALDDEWLDEPGAAEFVEARRGHDAFVDYASATDRDHPARQAQWYAMVSSRFGRGQATTRRRRHTFAPSALLLAAGL